jgi:hypothetical protein
MVAPGAGATVAAGGLSRAAPLPGRSAACTCRCSAGPAHLGRRSSSIRMKSMRCSATIATTSLQATAGNSAARSGVSRGQRRRQAFALFPSLVQTRATRALPTSSTCSTAATPPASSGGSMAAGASTRCSAGRLGCTMISTSSSAARRSSGCRHSSRVRTQRRGMVAGALRLRSGAGRQIDFHPRRV